MFPKDLANDATGARHEYYRINPFFIAVFSDDLEEEMDGFPKNAEYGCTQQVYDRFACRITTVEPDSISSCSDRTKEFLALCPFIEDPTRYHAWRRIAMGDWEDLSPTEVVKIMGSARLAIRLKNAYIDNKPRSR